MRADNEEMSLETFPMHHKVSLDRKAIDRVCEAADQCHLPGVAVGVSIAGRPEYRRGFGLANMEVPVGLSPATRMRIASITKQFTCLAYLLLCEAGRAHVDDRLDEHIPELPPVVGAVTIRQVMGHISGIRDACDWFFCDAVQRVAVDDTLSFYRALQDRNAPPGRRWCYNDGAYLLLGLAIERLADQPLEEVFKRQIFDPVGMPDTLLRRWDKEYIPRSAAAHLLNSRGRFEKAGRFTEGAGQGGILSNIDDMLRWLAHMDAPTVGSPETWTLMKTALDLDNGTSTGYALGLIHGRHRGLRTLWHAGMLLGGKTQIIKVPEALLDVVVMSNRHDLSAVVLASRVVDACLSSRPDSGRIRWDCVVGTYLSRTSRRLVELQDRDGIQVVAVDGAESTFEPTAERELHPGPEAAYRRQSIRWAGVSREPPSITLRDFGYTEELDRVGTRAAQQITHLAGRYSSALPFTQATIQEGPEGAILRIDGRFGVVTYRLENVAHDVWRARATGMLPLGAVLRVAPDGCAFRLTTPANWGVTFRRG
jgi:D-aminopeptidase